MQRKQQRESLPRDLVIRGSAKRTIRTQNIGVLGRQPGKRTKSVLQLRKIQSMRQSY